MLLVVAIPDQADFQVDTTAAWWLVDKSGAPLRSGRSGIAGMPRAERVIAIVPVARIVFIETTLPPVSADKRDELLRYAIEDKLTIDPATVHAVVIGKAEGSVPHAHIVAAIDRRWLQDALAWLDRAGLTVRQAFAETVLLPSASGVWHTLIDERHGVAVRSDGLAYSFDTELSGPAPFALTLALNEARSRTAANTHAPSIKLHAANDSTARALTPALALHWRDELGVPVDIAGVLDRARAHERLAKGDMPGANLLTGPFAPRHPGVGVLRLAKPALIAAGLILTTQVALTLLDAWRLSRQEAALRADMVQVFRSTFPDAKAIVDPALQMARNLDQLKRERGLAADDAKRILLARIASITRGAPSFRIARVRIEGAEARVEGALADPAALARLRDAAGREGGSIINNGNEVVIVVRTPS